jgi:hypothetical protein
MKKILFALALSLAAAGCAEGLGSDLEPRVSIVSAPPLGLPTTAPNIVVSPVSGGFQVNGSLSAPDTCRKITGELSAFSPADETSLTLVVRASPTGGACGAAVGYFDYRARVRPLPAGLYPLTVLHQIDQPGNPAPVEVYVGEIRIP